MRAVIIDYGSGNLRSAAKACERAARTLDDKARINVTADPQAVSNATHVILPGVGAFADCMAGLQGLPGMVEAVAHAVNVQGKPFLGICVGMQLLATVGYEHGTHDGFGWIAGRVMRIEAGPGIKVPHMGWNELDIARFDHPLLAGIAPDSPTGVHAYFVHSYHLIPDDPAAIVASVDYAGGLTAMVGRDNLVGTQFHPEKSQALGLTLLQNFLAWRS